MTAPHAFHRHKRRRREDSIQADIIGFLRAVLPPNEAMAYANPNASRRTEGGRAGNAVPGLTPGIPDLSIVIRNGRIFYFEVKAKDGKLSEAQQRMMDRLETMGVPAMVVRSIEDVRAALADWKIKTREAA